MASKIRQPNFGAGEISDKLYGRTDLPLYARALRKCRNFLPTPDGLLVNRPGFEYLGAVKTNAKKTRLIPFLFGGDQNYLLELGDLYFRVWYQGVYLGVDVVTTYVEADLFRLDYAQSGDILTITHPTYPPREIKRTAHTTWSIANKAFGSALSAPTGMALSGTPDEVGAAGYPAVKWSWKITAFNEDGDESAPSAELKTTSGLIALYNTPGVFVLPQGLTWTAVAGATGYYIYRGRDGTNGAFGLVGKSTTNAFVDSAQDPDYDQPPPTATNPFNATDKYPSVVAYHDQRLIFANTNLLPATIWGSRTGLFNVFDRLQPPGDDDSFTFRLAAKDFQEIRGLAPMKKLLALTNAAEWVCGNEAGDALTATTLGAQIQSARGSAWRKPLVTNNICLFTQARGSLVYDLAFEFESNGYRGNELSVFARHLVAGYTIDDWAFAEVPYSIAWMVRSDGILLGLTYNRETETSAWHWHDTDGVFESVAVVPEGNEDVLYAVIKRPIGAAQLRYIERLSTRRVTDVRLGRFLDSWKAIDGRNGGAVTMTLSAGSTWAAGEQATLTASSATFSTLNIFPNGTDLIQIWFRNAGVPIRCVPIAYTSTTVVTVLLLDDVPLAYRAAATTDWATANNEITGVNHLNGKSVKVLGDGNVYDDDTYTTGSGSAGQLGTPANDAHIDASITVNGSGLVALPFAVYRSYPMGGPNEGQFLALGVVGQSWGFVVLGCVGLAYTQEVELLDLASEQLEIRGKVKLVCAVSFEIETALDFSRKLKFGEVSTDLVPWQLLDVENNVSGHFSYLGAVAPALINTTVRVNSNWNRGGRAFVQNVDPLPVAIQSVTRELDLGE